MVVHKNIGIPAVEGDIVDSSSSIDRERSPLPPGIFRIAAVSSMPSTCVQHKKPGSWTTPGESHHVLFLDQEPMSFNQ